MQSKPKNLWMEQKIVPTFREKLDLVAYLFHNDNGQSRTFDDRPSIKASESSPTKSENLN